MSDKEYEKIIIPSIKEKLFIRIRDKSLNCKTLKTSDEDDKRRRRRKRRRIEIGT